MRNPVAWRACNPETGDDLWLCDRCAQSMRPVRSLPDEAWGVEIDGQVLTLTPVHPEDGLENGSCDLCRSAEGDIA